MKRKRKGKLLVQVGVLIMIVTILAMVLNGRFIYRNQYSFYVDAVRNEMLDLIVYARNEMQYYKALPWLMEYWKEHDKELNQGIPKYGERDQKWCEEHESIFRKAPKMITSEEAEKMSAKEQKLFAEYCYVMLEDEFDRMMETYWAASLLCSVKTSDESQWVYFNGRVTEAYYEEYVKAMALKNRDPYEEYAKPPLGKELPYHSRTMLTAEEIYETGEDLTDYDSTYINGMEYLIMYAPVCDEDGNVLGLVSGAMTTVGLKKRFTDLVFQILIFGMILIVIGGLVLLFILNNLTIRPMRTVQSLVRDYRRTKKSENIVGELEQIRTNNEVEDLAQDIAQMAVEMDNHIHEIVEITAEKERIGAELDFAQKVQVGVMPGDFPAFPDRDDFDIYASMNPAKEVGGDFYDFFLVDEDHLGLVIADVSGKGMPAALFMIQAKALIKNCMFSEKLSPVQTLENVNRSLIDGNREMMFVTAWVGILDLKTGILTYSSGGHEYPVVYHKGGAFEEILEDNAIPLAVMDGYEFRTFTMEMKPGDTLFLYTDGVPEAMNPADQQFGEERMIRVLNENPDDDPKSLNDRMIRALDEFTAGAQQFDDCTMLLVKRF